MQIVHKDATIVPTGDEAEMPGTFEVILSSPTKDRDGDTLLPNEWKQPLPARINFDADHGMSVAATVGSGIPRIDEQTGNLIVSGTYSSLPRAQEVRTLVNEGHIDRTSVTFMTVPDETKGAVKGAKVRELLSGAFVAIPSNREAVVLASKAMETTEAERVLSPEQATEMKAGARNSKSDLEKLQAAHDALVAMGAQCAADAEGGSGKSLKSIVGSVEALQDRARDALEDSSDEYEWWGYLRGVLPNSAGDGGVLIFQKGDDVYSQTYTDDGAVVTLTGTATEVDIHEVVVPDADADRETDDLTLRAASDVDSDAVWLQAAAIQARASLALSD